MNQNDKWRQITSAAAWLSTSAAVVAAIVFTQSGTPLWAMLIPFVAGYISTGEKE